MNDVRRSWRFWRRILVANVAAALMVMAFNGVFAEAMPWSRRAVFFGLSLIYTTPVSAMLGFGLSSVIPRLARYTTAVQWVGRFVAILVLTAIGLAAAGFVLVLAGDLGPSEFWRQFVRSFGLAATIALTTSTTVTIFEGLRTRLDETTIALRTKELEEERARKLATEAQLAALESRIHPHFLFNTLNTISALIQEDPAKAERTVGQLAALLRSSLDATMGGSVPLAQELRIVRDYLDIESARFGERLSFHIDVHPTLGDRPVPPLSVQTLVENAVKHGLSTRRDDGRITVRARPNGDGMRIEVADNGERFSASEFPAGHGLDNLRSRLRVLYADKAHIKLSRERGWTTAIIRIDSFGESDGA